MYYIHVVLYTYVNICISKYVLFEYARSYTYVYIVFIGYICYPSKVMGALEPAQ